MDYRSYPRLSPDGPRVRAKAAGRSNKRFGCLTTSESGGTLGFCAAEEGRPGRSNSSSPFGCTSRTKMGSASLWAWRGVGADRECPGGSGRLLPCGSIGPKRYLLPGSLQQNDSRLEKPAGQITAGSWFLRSHTGYALLASGCPRACRRQIWHKRSHTLPIVTQRTGKRTHFRQTSHAVLY